MCTLTYMPFEDGFVMMSSRDEAVHRGIMLPPKLNQENQSVYPVDEASNGTWILTSVKGFSLNMLNGGYLKHERHVPYKHSRGIVPILFLEYSNVQKFVQEFDFQGLEPFTLIVVQHEPRKTYAIVWTGNEVHCDEYPDNKPHIWSSSTLYDTKAKQLRRDWFNSSINNEINDTPFSRLLQFHQIGGDTYPDESVRIKMKRDNGLQTICISGIIYTESQYKFYFNDLLSGHESKVSIIQ